MFPDSMNQPILEALRLPESEPEKFTHKDEEEEVECLLCDTKFYISNGELLPVAANFATNSATSGGDTGKDQLLKHLLVQHNFVIGDVHLVANLPEYISYWKKKFLKHPLTAYCVSIKASVKDMNTTSSMKQFPSSTAAPSSGKGDVEIREFSMLSDVIPEDKELRQKLQNDRLEKVLRIHEAENNTEDFHRTCLFCRQDFEEHKGLFDHMAFDHNFSVGQPANLVFVKKFLDLLQSKLEGLICLYCEKVFKSRDVLKEHMRKKGHKKLNPQNKEYDAFYLVNYLEFGRTWEDISRDPADEEIISGFDVVAEKDDNHHEWGSWRDNVGKVVCLFCQAAYDHSSDLFDHMLQSHGFNFVKLKQDLRLGFYQQIKMINYIRRCVHLNTCFGCSMKLDSPEKLSEHISWSNHFTPDESEWNQSQYLFPTYENDNLLHCLEEDDVVEDGGSSARATATIDDGDESSDLVVPEPLDTHAISQQSILQDYNVRKSLMMKKSS